MSKARIFISYSVKDIKIVEQLHQKLEAAGFDVWRDQTRLETNWSREIALAIAETDVLCLFWTEHSAQTKWVRHEWLTARALEKLIVPCLFPNAPTLPEPLFNIQGVAFEDVAKDSSKLIERLKSTTLFTVKYDYTVLPPNSYIPFNPNPHFTGRQLDLVELYLKMIGNLNKIGINQVGTVGMGGIGKTQLAVEFAYRFSFAFDGIYWMQVADSDQWLRQFVQLARDRLQLKIANPESPDANEQYLFALQNYCKAHPQMLIIMDNVRDPKLLHSERPFYSQAGGLAPLTLGCNLLFTTRRHFQLPGVTSQVVDVLSPEAAYALLTRDRKPETSDEEEHAKAICNAVGYLPLALVLAAGFLNKYRTVSFADYHAELVKNKLDTIDVGEISPEELATRHEAAVGVTLKSQWEILADENAKRLFQLAGLFPEATIIPKARLGLLSGIGSGTSKIDQPLEKAFLLLQELNLVEKFESAAGAIRLHPLVRDFVYWRLVPESEQLAFKAVAVANLKTAYDDPLHLESEYDKRGIDEVIADLQMAIDWSERRSTILPQLELIRRMLDRERSHLRSDTLNLSGPPPSFLQQLNYRAQCLGLKNVAQKFFEAKYGKRRGIFKTIATSELEDTAWVRTFKGHSQLVTSVSLSTDSKFGISGCLDDTIIVWDVDTGKSRRTLRGHDEWVNAVKLSKDNQYALSGSADCNLILWKLDTGEALRVFRGHIAPVTSVCISTDNRYALSSSLDGTLRLWDISNGNIMQTLIGHSNQVMSVSLSVDGKRAVSGAWDKSVILWDVENGRLLRKFTSHKHIVFTVKISADGSRALSGSEDKTIILWDLESGRKIRTLKDHSDGVLSVDISNDGLIALSGSKDRALILWNLKNGDVLRKFKGHSDWITSVSLSADKRHALSGSWDQSLILWDLNNAVSSNIKRGHTKAVTDIAFAADGQFVLSSSEDKTLTLWNAKTGNYVRTLKGHSDIAKAVSLSSDGKLAISGSNDRTLILWDVRSGKALHTFKEHSGVITAVSMSSDGRLAISASEDKTIKLWDLKSCLLIRSYLVDPACPIAAYLSDDGKYGISGHDDKTLILWEIETGNRLQKFFGHTNAIMDVSLNIKSSLALSGSLDSTLRLWDIKSGNSLLTLYGHSGGVRSVVLDVENKRAVSSSNDKTIILWDIDTGKIVNRLFVKNLARCLALIDNRIVIGDDDGLLYFFEIVE